MTAKLPEISNAIRAAFATKAAGDVVLRAAQPRVVAKSASFTVTDQDSNTIFVSTAALTATLPSIAKVGNGFVVIVFSSVADALTVASNASDDMILPNDAGGASYTPSTPTVGDSLTLISYQASTGADGTWYAVAAKGDWAS